MSAPELKPFPFCSSRGIDTDENWRRNYCTNCGAKGPAAGNAIRAEWNTRADIPAARIAELEAEVARLRGGFAGYAKTCRCSERK